MGGHARAVARADVFRPRRAAHAGCRFDRTADLGRRKPVAAGAVRREGCRCRTRHARRSTTAGLLATLERRRTAGRRRTGHDCAGRHVRRAGIDRVCVDARRARQRRPAPVGHGRRTAVSRADRRRRPRAGDVRRGRVEWRRHRSRRRRRIARRAGHDGARQARPRADGPAHARHVGHRIDDDDPRARIVPAHADRLPHRRSGSGKAIRSARSRRRRFPAEAHSPAASDRRDRKPRQARTRAGQAAHDRSQPPSGDRPDGAPGVAAAIEHRVAGRTPAACTSSKSKAPRRCANASATPRSNA